MPTLPPQRTNIENVVADTSYRLFMDWAAKMSPDADIAEFEKVARKSFRVSLNYMDTMREEILQLQNNIKKFGNLQGRVSVEKGF